MSTIVVSILQRRKLGLREAKRISQNQLTSKDWQPPIKQIPCLPQA